MEYFTNQHKKMITSIHNRISPSAWLSVILGFCLIMIATLYYGISGIKQARRIEAVNVLSIDHHTSSLKTEVKSWVQQLSASLEDKSKLAQFTLLSELVHSRISFMDKIIQNAPNDGQFFGDYRLHLKGIEGVVDRAQGLQKNGGIDETNGQKLIKAMAEEEDYFSGDAQVQLQMSLDRQNRLNSVFVTIALALVVAVEVCTISLAWAFMRLNQQNHVLAELTRRDPLTGLLNRRGGMESGTQAIALAHRLGHYISLAILDLDKFKAINDRYGHPAGDAVLCHAASIIKSHCRETDTVARLGGEEFLVMMMTPTESGAHGVFEALRERLATTPAMAEGVAKPIAYTVSIGVVTVKTDSTNSIEDLYARADRALYNAKSNGRNQVMAA